MGEWSSAGDLMFGFPVRRRSRSALRWRMFSGNVWVSAWTGGMVAVRAKIVDWRD